MILIANINKHPGVSESGPPNFCLRLRLEQIGFEPILLISNR